MADSDFKNKDEFEGLLLKFPERIGTQSNGYHVLLGMIDNCIERSKIIPAFGDLSKLKQYNQLYKTIFDYFGEISENISVDDPRTHFPFHVIRVKLEAWELITEKSEEINGIISLLNLSDEVIFTGDEEDFFHISFYVKGIWQE